MIIIQLYRLLRTRETLNHILEARDKDLLALKKTKYLHDQFRLGLTNKLSFTAISTKMLNCCKKTMTVLSSSLICGPIFKLHIYDMVEMFQSNVDIAL